MFETRSKCLDQAKYVSYDNARFYKPENWKQIECGRIFSTTSKQCKLCSRYRKCFHDEKYKEREKEWEIEMKNFVKNISWNCTEIEVQNPCASIHPDTTFYVEGHLDTNYRYPSMSFDTMRELIYHHLNELPMQGTVSPSIKNVIFNPPATIVFWGDGSKTVVKCQDGEDFDPEKGLTMAFFKKMHDNKGHYFEEIKKWTHKYAMSLFKDEVHTINDEQIEKAIEAGMSKAPRLLVEIHNDENLPKVEDNVELKELVSKELKMSYDKSIRWAIFYARVDRGETEGFVQHALVYKHKSSATRAAKRLISNLPAGVMYEWYVDTINVDDNWT